MCLRAPSRRPLSLDQRHVLRSKIAPVNATKMFAEPKLLSFILQALMSLLLASETLTALHTQQQKLPTNWSLQ